MTNQQAPAALRLAEELELDPSVNRPSVVAELRRLHAENTTLQQGYDAARMEIEGLRDRVQELGAMPRENCNRRIVELEAQLEAIGAGGVEPLHQISEPAGYTVPPGYRLQPLSEFDAMCAAQSAREQHPDDDAVDALAKLMKAKLAKQRAKGYGGWDTPECTQQRLSDMLRAHVDKGDPVDVANFCAFLAARGEGIAQAAPAAENDAEDAARYRWLKSQASEELLNPRAALSEICPDMRTHWKLPTLICSGPVGGYLGFDASIDAAMKAGGAA